eukprot:5183571-Alexandrium_andersonii.AAC.1
MHRACIYPLLGPNKYPQPQLNTFSPSGRIPQLRSKRGNTAPPERLSRVGEGGQKVGRVYKNACFLRKERQGAPWR